MNQAHPARTEQRAQPADGGEMECGGHRHGLERKAGGAGLGHERTVGLPDHEHVAPVCEEPPGLGEDADLLSAVSPRGLGVSDQVTV